MKKLKLLLIFIFGFFSLCFADETLTITTYYPSPYGSYQDLYVADQLGIGTTTPVSYAVLDVNTSGNKSIHTMSSSEGGLLIGYQGPSIQGRTSGDSNGNLYLNNFGGKVGIGTTNPQKKLHMVGDGLRVDNTSESVFMTGNTYMTLVQVDGAGAAGYAKIGAYRAGEGWKNLVLSGDGGNVGIGTTSPTAKLDVNGNVKASAYNICYCIQSFSSEGGVYGTEQCAQFGSYTAVSPFPPTGTVTNDGSGFRIKLYACP